MAFALGGYQPPADSLLARRPWLTNASSWCASTGPDDEYDVDDRGVWPIGNGYVFAHAGLAAPFNRLQGLVGPSYQTEGVHRPSGAFGDCWAELRVGLEPVPLPHDHIWRPRESGVLVTVAYRHGMALTTIDFAHPIAAAVVRIVETWCGGDVPTDVAIVAPHASGARGSSRLEIPYRPGQFMVVAVVGSPAHGEGRCLRLPHCPHSGGVQRATVILSAGRDADEAHRQVDRLGDVVDLLEETRDHWRRWLAKTTTPALWPQRFGGPTADVQRTADLIEATKLQLKMQQALPGGGVSPMVHFKGVWARDSSGPIRAFMQMGAVDEVRAQLEYYYRASCILGRIPNSAPLDLDVDAAREPADWERVPVPHAEVPSFVILQHRWWLDAGGDVELVRRHWNYLRRCATGQKVGRNGLQSFNGDETFLHGALYSVFPDRCGWPNDLIGDDIDSGYAPWSLSSCVAYVVAQEAMAWMAARVGREGEVAEYATSGRQMRGQIERCFWLPDRGFYAPALYPLSGVPHATPFAPVNLQPLWLGYHGVADARARPNLDAVLSHVGWTGVTPRCGYNVGTTPSYLLQGLLSVESDLAPTGLANLVSMASPAGDWAEVYSPDGRVHGGYDPATPNRLRPWESGLALDAIYRYFRERRPEDEPFETLTGPEPVVVGPIPLPATKTTVVVTADRSELDELLRAAAVERDEVTVLEPALPCDADLFDRVLYDAGSGARIVDVLVLGASATKTSRRSMKAAAFWESAAVVDALERFRGEGGTVRAVDP